MGDTSFVMSGTLYLVATPIGNLEDITYRAVRILKEVSQIACEDTRQTRKLLNHFDIDARLVSYHEHNEKQRAPELIQKLTDGNDIAVVSDAGTPLISDPGYHLVSQAAAAGIPIVPIPGPSAAITALVASGLRADSFVFLGFLPPKGKHRREAMELIRTLDQTVILYEAPHRILATLDDLRSVIGDRQIVAAREMTKLHEEFLRGTADSIRESLAVRPAVKGEFTVVISKPEVQSAPKPNDDAIRAAVVRNIDEGQPRMDAIKAAARELGIPKRSVYKAFEEAPDA
jgi:16S rRNA (cytidine1402-2'-O)-methyltransferase